MEAIINTEEVGALFQQAFTVPVCLLRQQNTSNEALNIMLTWSNISVQSQWLLSDVIFY